MEPEDKLTIIIINQYGDERLNLCKLSLEASILGLDVNYILTTEDTLTEDIKENQARYTLIIHGCCIVGEDMVRSALYYLDEHPSVADLVVKMLDCNGQLDASADYYLRFVRSPLPDSYVYTPVVLDSIGGAILKKESVVAAVQPSLMKRFVATIIGGLSAKKTRHRRLLVMAASGSYQDTKDACVAQLSGLEFVNRWNLDDKRPLDAINRSTQMKDFSDIVFCYPNVRFEQMLLFMNQMPNKSITYHLYNKINGELVSC